MPLRSSVRGYTSLQLVVRVDCRWCVGVHDGHITCRVVRVIEPDAVAKLMNCYELEFWAPHRIGVVPIEVHLGCRLKPLGDRVAGKLSYGVVVSTSVILRKPIHLGWRAVQSIFYYRWRRQ